MSCVISHDLLKQALDDAAREALAEMLGTIQVEFKEVEFSFQQYRDSYIVAIDGPQGGALAAFFKSKEAARFGKLIIECSGLDENQIRAHDADETHNLQTSATLEFCNRIAAILISKLPEAKGGRISFPIMFNGRVLHMAWRYPTQIAYQVLLGGQLDFVLIVGIGANPRDKSSTRERLRTIDDIRSQLGVNLA